MKKIVQEDVSENMDRRTMPIHRCIVIAAAVVMLVAGIGVMGWQLTRSGKENAEEESLVGDEGDLSDTGEVFRDGDDRKLQGAVQTAKVTEDDAEGNDEGEGGDKTEDESEAEGNDVGENSGITGDEDEAKGNGEGENSGITESDEQQDDPSPTVFEAFSTSVTGEFWEEIISEYGVLIDVESQEILAAKDCQVRMNPASMTKVLTVLTAAEALGLTEGTEEVLDDTFTMIAEITDYCYLNNCSVAGFSVGEVIPVRDLFYGVVLPSGADAAVGLAIYTAGSHEAFVGLMNEKLEQLGLADSTHIANCVGLYDEDHYSTAYDIAVILKEAADNPFCREILSAHTYSTSLTEKHPEGLFLSNRFLCKIEELDTHGEVLCGKTGYVDESGNCAASLSVDKNGREYLCVIAGADSREQCILDHCMLYVKYLPGEEE